MNNPCAHVRCEITASVIWSQSRLIPLDRADGHLVWSDWFPYRVFSRGDEVADPNKTYFENGHLYFENGSSLHDWDLRVVGARPMTTLVQRIQIPDGAQRCAAKSQLRAWNVSQTARPINRSRSLL